MNLRTFEDLEVWKKGRDVRLFVQDVVKKFPAEEKFALSLQIRKSSRSITNNIAEGYGRFFYQENIQFCRISRGSLTEIEHDSIFIHWHYYKPCEIPCGSSKTNNKHMKLWTIC